MAFKNQSQGRRLWEAVQKPGLARLFMAGFGLQAKAGTSLVVFVNRDQRGGDGTGDGGVLSSRSPTVNLLYSQFQPKPTAQA